MNKHCIKFPNILAILTFTVIFCDESGKKFNGTRKSRSRKSLDVYDRILKFTPARI